MSKTISRSVMPMGTSTSPVFLTLPASAKTLVPLLPSVPIAANQSAPVEHDRRHVGQGLDVVDDGRLAPEPRDGREGRPRPRHAAPALDRGDQRRLLAADEGAGALLDLEVEAEAGAEDVVAEQAAAPRACVDGDVQVLDGQRVLGAARRCSLRWRRWRRRRSPCPRARVRVALEHARSMNAPGSPSSALQITYFASPGCSAASSHFMPVGKPPPPRPRRPARRAPRR